MKKIYVIIPVLLIISFFVYKGVMLAKYYFEEDSYTMEVFGKIWFKEDTINIQTDNTEKEGYLINENAKIRIEGKCENVLNERMLSAFVKMYTVDDDNGTLEDTDKSITIFSKMDSVMKTISELEKSEEYKDVMHDLKEILKEKNINNDVDILKYLYSRKNYNIKNNIFTPVKQMKENLLTNLLITCVSNGGIGIHENGINVIDGDYIGYMTTEFKDGVEMKYANILKDGYTYRFVFCNFEENEVIQALNSIVIE